MTTLIVTPLPEEQQFLVSALAGAGCTAERVNIGPIDIYEFPKLNFAVARGGHGKTQLAVHTRYLLDKLPDVKQVICAGAAGALAPELHVGDIVIASITVEHDYLLKFVTRPDPAFLGDAEMLAEFTSLESTDTYNVRVGIVASGDEDVIDLLRGSAIREQTGALAVAWEGAGAARAAGLTETPVLEIRGITDSANHDAPGDFETHLERAMASIAHLLISWRSTKSTELPPR